MTNTRFVVSKREAFLGLRLPMAVYHSPPPRPIHEVPWLTGGGGGDLRVARDYISCSTPTLLVYIGEIYANATGKTNARVGR